MISIYFDVQKEVTKIGEIDVGAILVDGLDEFFSNPTTDKITKFRQELTTLVNITPFKKLYCIKDFVVVIIRFTRDGNMLQIDLMDEKTLRNRAVMNIDPNNIFTIRLIKEGK